eukprot:scaffold312193_cov28-Prasinocladus_malaysianus.AAC.1
MSCMPPHPTKLSADDHKASQTGNAFSDNVNKRLALTQSQADVGDHSGACAGPGRLEHGRPRGLHGRGRRRPAAAGRSVAPPRLRFFFLPAVARPEKYCRKEDENHLKCYS